jgi:hypothetical protein
MIDTGLDFAQPYELNPDEEKLESLQEAKEAFDKAPDNFAIETELVHALVDAATSSRWGANTPDKPTVPLTDKERLLLPPNCIDTSLSQLDAAGRVNIKAMAMLSVGHASTIIKLNDHFWHIDGGSKNDARKENLLLHNGEVSKKAIRIRKCLKFLETAEHCYAWTDYATFEEGYTPFNSPHIRNPKIVTSTDVEGVGELPEELSSSGFVVLSSQDAPYILRAVDVLAGISKRPIDNGDTSRRCREYIQILKPLTPKNPRRN